MLSLDLALSLQASGLIWSPARGDRFVVRERGMDTDVFVLSDFTIEVHELPTGPVIGFNGTTEWALDSVDLTQVLWLPREDQLRELLGSRFRRLEATTTGWTVVAAVGDHEELFVGADVEDLYARAVVATPPEPRVPQQASG